MKRSAKLCLIAAAAVLIGAAAVWLVFFRGHFYESDFERARKSIRLGGRELCFPLDADDPGGGLRAKINEKAGGSEYGTFFSADKKVMEFSADVVSRRTRWIHISCGHDDDDYDTALIKTFEIDGLAFGDSEKKVRSKYGSPQDVQNNGSERVLEYMIYKDDRIWKNLEFCFDDSGLAEVFVFENNI